MSIDHGKLLALADDIENRGDKWAADKLRALAQPAEAVEAEPMRATHFCISGEEVGGHSVDDVAEQWIETASLKPGERFDVQAWAHTQTHSVLVTDDGFSVEGIEAGDAYQELIDAIKGDAAQGAVAFGHVYRGVANEETAKRPWKDAGTVFVIGPAPHEGVHGVIQYMNVYTHPQAAPAQGDGMVLVGYSSRKQIDRLRTDLDLTGIMVHDEQSSTINVPMYARLAAAPSRERE